MGRPGFFKVLSKYFSNKLIQSSVDGLSHLFIDANCFFHPECFKIINAYPGLVGDTLDQKLLTAIMNYLEYIFRQLTAY